MFRKILIANRGAIACRIIRTLKKMGVRSVAVYSDADVHSLHVSAADEAFRLGPAAAAESYLNFQAIFLAARQSGAEAIHPGYGFLSENADFAAACAREGFVFIGPTPEQIRAFGLKHAARELAGKAGVPLLAGSGLLEHLTDARREAERVGYPVVLKSTAGGGGIGMRLCANPDELEAAFFTVRRLGENTFKQAGVFLEKYLPQARHIEVQLFGDGRGQVISLGERECSAQRRNQKVIEETPAPGLGDDARRQLHEMAARLASGRDYRSAGTVEFILDVSSGRFYFLEVNTRLQVEHGVTEEVSGVDLVEWMVRLAAGEDGPWSAYRHAPRGSSIQVRVYAEDPNRNFQPSPGLLTEAVFPTDVRVETWVEQGSEIPPFYDPLIAKIIVWGNDRAEAVRRLAAALAGCRVSGIESNLAYLRQVVASEDFGRGQIHTRWLAGFAYAPDTIDVLEPGAQTSIQDYPGRTGYWSIGVPPSGPMDDYAFRLANRLVGNDESAAGLEITFSGPTLKFNKAATVAVTGAGFEMDVDGQPVAGWRSFTVQRGGVLRIRGVKGAGCRGTLAVKGGFQVPEYLGSKSTFSFGKFGGHAGRDLRQGDVLHLAPGRQDSADNRAIPLGLIPEYGQSWEIAVLFGPHAAPDFVTPRFAEQFLAADWQVHYNSNRLGIRLLGPKPGWARADGGEAGVHPSNIFDSEYAVGTVNFMGDMPVILGKDGPSLGGFVCPATIIRAELWKIGQVRPGDTIRFVRTTFARALEAERRQDAAIAALAPSPPIALAGPRMVFDPAQGDGAVLHRIEPAAGRPAVVYRQAGDKYLLIEYGPPQLDLEMRFRVHALMEWLQAHPVDGVLELSPGVRSLQVNFDSRRLALARLLRVLIEAEAALPAGDALDIPTRVLKLPLAFDASSTREAIEKYRQSMRAAAPWLPSNIEFIRRINGLGAVEEVGAAIFSASYLVLGLGDVYLGAPCAVPIDPRHRLVTTKYNPARTWTAEGEVGIGGVCMCIYGMESPGGYQLVGRTVPVWNTYRRTAEFAAGRPWLLRFFDQIRFYPMPEKDLLEYRAAFLRGQVTLDIREEVFSAREHRLFLAAHGTEIAAFKRRQQAGFEAERERWKSAPAWAPAPHPGADGSRPALVALDQKEEMVSAPIAGSIWAVPVAPGDRVAAGDKVAVVEAMKMEVVIESPVSGKVGRILAGRGSVVSPGQPILTVFADPDLNALSLDLKSLQSAYAAATFSPRDVVGAIYARIARRGDDHVWIHLISEAEVLNRVDAQVRRRAAGAELPLFGVPFAIKDNIDVAGLPTTAGCPAYRYVAKETAPAVQRLLDAGAILIGKTNLDQFATGLVGVRSPYGACASVFNSKYISGGSSAGSAVAVAAGLVSFALGTDTAGSGRVPAAFNNLVGWKPTRGLLSSGGVVPACQSLDCISIFTLVADDAQMLARIVASYDPADPYSRRSPQKRRKIPAHFRFGVPARQEREFFGNRAYAALFEAAVERMRLLGGTPVEIDLAPFVEAAEMLYSGPWLAERMVAIREFFRRQPEALHPVTAEIIGRGAEYTAADAFESFHRLEVLRRKTEESWKSMDVLFLPTTGTTYTLEEVENDPIRLNSLLGRYTNFVNLLDLCAVAVPSGFTIEGLPFGVSLIGGAFDDQEMLALAEKFHRAVGGQLGGTDVQLGSLSSDPLPPAVRPAGAVILAVAGAHLRGQPLHHQLTARDAEFVRTTRTSGDYRLFSLKGTEPAKPGLVRTPGLEGPGIEVELWALDEAALGGLMAEVPPPMAIGAVKLQDGSSVKGFLCEAFAIEGSRDITVFGGWRAYLGSLCATQGKPSADGSPPYSARTIV